MRTRPRTEIAIAVAAVIVVLFMAASFRLFSQIKEVSEARSHVAEILQAAEELVSVLRDAETAQRSYALTGDESFLVPFQAQQDIVHGSLEKLLRITMNRSAQGHLGAIAPLVEAKLNEMNAVIKLRRQKEYSTVLSLLGTNVEKRSLEAIRSELNAYIKIEKAMQAHIEVDAESSMRRLYSFILLVSLLVILVALSILVLIHRESRHLQEKQDHLEIRQSLSNEEKTNHQLQSILDTLRISEERLSVTLDSIGDAVIATDASGRVTLMNPRAEVLTGWTQTEAEDHPIGEVFVILNQEDRQRSPLPVQGTILEGSKHSLAKNTILVARGGRECTIADSRSPIQDRNGQVIGAVLVFRDTTAELESQQAVRDNTAMIQTILNTVVDGIITLKASDASIESINPAAERMLGYAPLELIGKNVSLVIPEFDREKNNGFLEYYSNSDKRGDAGIGHEVIGLRRNGSSVPLEIAISEMRLSGKGFFTGIFRDISARKLAEEELLKGGALQDAIFNSANFSSIATDSRGVIQIFNVGAERMLGYLAAEVVNTITPADISDPEEVIARAEALSLELGTTIAPGFEALVFKASRGIEDIYELTYIRKDGSRFPAIVSVTALRDDQSVIIGYLLIGTDNTARKQAEDALLQAGALQSAIFNSANFSSIATDAKGVIQIFNVGAERMLGYAAIEVMNKITPADISDPEEVIARAQALTLELDTPIQPGFEALVFKASRGIEDIYELTYIRKDGSRFPAMVSVTALRDNRGLILGYLLIGTDNTARKLVEAEQTRLGQRLRDSQFYARSLFESNVDALITTDPSGYITDLNKQMERLTGCTRDELIGGAFKGHFTDPDRAEASIHLALHEKKIVNFELTALARDGKETVVSFNATTFFDRDRNLQGVFGAARDITEAKHLDLVLQGKNVELEGAKYAAEKANLAKSEFLSSMSHELRSPLNAILGFAQLMESDPTIPTPSQQESLGQILHAGWHLLKLIDQILDLAKVESGHLPLSHEPVSLVEVMHECQSLIEHQARQRDIRITFPSFAEPYFVHADHTRVKQVVVNLLSNAIKYNVQQGSVEVECTETSPGRIRTSIRDTGIGLYPEQLGQLFQAFNRLGQEAGREEGTGIGLVVAKRLVELMGGTIGVESTYGAGSVFWFELVSAEQPLVPVEPEGHEAPMEHRTMRSPGLHTVLYIEDNTANMKLVEQIIYRYPDLRLLTADTGHGGIDLAHEERPDLILMDINLPDISGIDALQILRSHPDTTNIVVIALSANAMPLDIERARRAGFFRYLTKPINITEFMEALDEALEFADHKPYGEAFVEPLP